MAKADVKTNITKFLSGDNIILNSEEEKILARWEFAVQQLTLKQLKYHELRDKIALKFHVSRFTAENDITTAQEVFGTNRTINKRFLLHAHIDRMDETIEQYKALLFKEEKDSDGKLRKRFPSEKEMTAIAKLSDAYTYAINSAPAEVDTTRMPPPIFVFSLPDGVTLPLPPLKQLTQAVDEYLEFTMTSNDQQDPQSARPADQEQSDADTAHDD